MKKLLLISMVAIIVLTMMVPVTFAGGPKPPLKGNTTNVWVNGTGNSGMVMVQGSGNHTNLYFAPKTKFNQALVGVMGCGNKTSVGFGYGAKGNSVGVMVYSPCRR